MNKIRINLDVVLPDVPDQRDACVSRITSVLAGKKGIEKVHIVPETSTRKHKYVCIMIREY